MRGAGTLPDAEIAGNKRNIDRYNQKRNDAIERIDEQLLHLLSAVRPDPDARLNSETPGAMIDRLSILSLKIRQMRLQTERNDVDSRSHRRLPREAGSPERAANGPGGLPRPAARRVRVAATAISRSTASSRCTTTRRSIRRSTARASAPADRRQRSSGSSLTLWGASSHAAFAPRGAHCAGAGDTPVSAKNPSTPPGLAAAKCIRPESGNRLVRAPQMRPSASAIGPRNGWSCGASPRAAASSSGCATASSPGIERVAGFAGRPHEHGIETPALPEVRAPAQGPARCEGCFFGRRAPRPSTTY